MGNVPAAKPSASPESFSMPTPAAAGYSRTVLVTATRRRVARQILTFGVVAFVFAAIGLASIYFLVKVPRERSEGADTVLGRAAVGGLKVANAVTAAITAPDITKSDSVLPKMEFYLRGDRLDALNADLPDSGREFQEADVRLSQDATTAKTYGAKVRYRGDSVNHWGFPQKSWRVQLKGAELYQGRRSFNLYLPRTPSRIADYIGYEMGERIGLLSPMAYPVHFRVNRKFDGTRIFLEQVDESFLTARSLDAGYIYVGDITTEQIYTPESRKPLFHHPEIWTIEAPNLDRGVADGDFGERNALKHLISVLNRKRSIYEFVPKIREILNVDAALSYMALLDIVGSNHVDDTHNHKWYLNPRRGVLEPIVWDTAAYMWGDRQDIDKPGNMLFERLLGVPEFRHQKHQKMWEYINGALGTLELSQFVREEYARLSPDVEADPFKLEAVHTTVNFIDNAAFHNGVKELLAAIKGRNEHILAHLRDARIEGVLVGTEAKTSEGGYYTSTARDLLLTVPGVAAVNVPAITMDVQGGSALTRVRVERLGLDAVGGEIPLSKRVVYGSAVGAESAKVSKIRVPLMDTLYAKGVANSTWETRSRAQALADPKKGKLPKGGPTALYRYRISLQGPGVFASGVGVEAQNAVTGEALAPLAVALTDAVPDGLESSTSPGWWSPELFSEATPVRWSGEVNVTKSLVLPLGADLIVAPGTTVSICERCSVLVRGGRLIAEGSPQEPITFRGPAPGASMTKFAPLRSFTTVALQGVPGMKVRPSRLRNVRILGGSEGEVAYTYYRGGLAVHGTSATLEDVEFVGTPLGVVDGDLQLNQVKFTGGMPRSIIKENSLVRSNNVVIDPPQSITSTELAKAVSLGTPTRAEREYRYAISRADPSDTNPIDGKELALVFNRALAEAVKSGNRWNAPRYTNTQYRMVAAVVGESLYRDIYLDTADYMNEKHHVSYRLRNRFKDRRTHDRHVKSPQNPDFWPYRIEFQGKTGREADENSMTTVEEARFEMRRQSKPFSIQDPPPPPPWPLPDYLAIMRSGRFGDFVPEPVRHVMAYYSKAVPDRSEYAFVPTTVVVTTRRRQHLEIKSPWGSGPNPEQAYIITLDESAVFPAAPFVAAVEAGWRGEKVTIPKASGAIFEVEVEFERNVSSKLDAEIQARTSADANDPKLPELRAALQAFVDDQMVIVESIRGVLAEDGFVVKPVFESKYRQSLALIRARNK